MKKLLAIAIAIMAILTAAAPQAQAQTKDPATSGELKITGLKAYAGKYVCATSSSGSPADIFAGNSFNDDNNKNVLIRADGTATLKVWVIINYVRAGDYNKTETHDRFYIKIFNGKEMSSDLVTQAHDGPVNFTKGKAAADVSDWGF